MIDNRTQRLDLPLPDIDNYLEDDVTRLKEALTTIDQSVATISEEGKLSEEQIPGHVALLDTSNKLPAGNLPMSAVQTDADGKIPASVVPVGELGLASDEELQLVQQAVQAADEKAQRALENGSDAVLDIKWLTTRSPMRTGYTPGDGQILQRALYPDAVAAIQAGLVPVCSDADWLDDPLKRGCFTLGDGATTFRVPDYNGKSAGSVGRIFLGGDGLNSAGTNGLIQGDAIRNIAGIIESAGSGLNRSYGIGFESVSGSFYKLSQNGFDLGPIASTQIRQVGLGSVGFDASRVVPTAADNHPVNVTGCWAVKLFGAVQNAGSADAAALATAVASLASRITTLEQATTIVNSAGQAASLGFVRETVSAGLPANLAINTRYSLTNPFGVATPVRCTLYLYVNSKWSEVDSSMAAIATGYGAKAFYVPGEGVVIQTGRNGLMSASTDTLSGHANTTSTVTSAPAVVHIERMAV